MVSKASLCLDKEGMDTAQGLAGGLWGKAVHITAYQEADIMTQMVGLKDLLTVTYFLKLAPLLMVPRPPYTGQSADEYTFNNLTYGDHCRCKLQCISSETSSMLCQHLAQGFAHECLLSSLNVSIDVTKHCLVYSHFKFNLSLNPESYNACYVIHLHTLRYTCSTHKLTVVFAHSVSKQKLVVLLMGKTDITVCKL